MKNNKLTLILIAAVVVAAALAAGGCVDSLRNALTPATPTPLPATPTPTVTATVKPTPTVEATPVHVDLIYTAPLEAGKNNTSPIHVLTGNITYNGEPAVGYGVLIDTVNGSEYGNKTDDMGYFKVTFRDDYSPTYVMKVTDSSNIVLYMDKTPRPVSETVPLYIKINVPPSKQISVTITPV